MNRFKKAFGLAAIGLGGLLTVSAAADVITALAIDPAGKKLYWQFSTDKDFNAYRVILTDKDTGAVQKWEISSPAYAKGEANHRDNVLILGDHYKVEFRVQWVPGGAFDPEWVPLSFVA